MSPSASRSRKQIKRSELFYALRWLGIEDVDFDLVREIRMDRHGIRIELFDDPRTVGYGGEPCITYVNYEFEADYAGE